MTDIDIDHLRQWIGRTETRHDLAAARPVAAMAATLDREDGMPVPGDGVPPLWHWMFFASLSRHSDVAADGHTKLGGFLPPVPLPRRMFAGGRFEFHHPLRIGDDITRVSTVKGVTSKRGRTGDMVFVTVQHDISDAQGFAVREEHDIVYREAAKLGAAQSQPRPAPTDEVFSREIDPDPVLLFRYSALTFNGHRIHYDRTYVTEVEGYPGLIVHGPLIATLLVDLLRRSLPDAQIKGFSFRAMSPLFDTHRFTVCARPEADDKVALWARDHEGSLAMQASAELVS